MTNVAGGAPREARYREIRVQDSWLRIDLRQVKAATVAIPAQGRTTALGVAAIPLFQFKAGPWTGAGTDW